MYPHIITPYTGMYPHIINPFSVLLHSQHLSLNLLFLIFLLLFIFKALSIVLTAIWHLFTSLESVFTSEAHQVWLSRELYTAQLLRFHSMKPILALAALWLFTEYFFRYLYYSFFLKLWSIRSMNGIELARTGFFCFRKRWLKFMHDFFEVNYVQFRVLPGRVANLVFRVETERLDWT